MLHLLPQPRSLLMKEGAFVLSPDMRIGLEQAHYGTRRVAAEQLQQEIADACGVQVAIGAGSEETGDILLTFGPDAPQGYALDVAPHGVRVAARYRDGVLQGVQTLRQIIRQCGWTLPALAIEDAPVYAARGFYHDVTR